MNKTIISILVPIIVVLAGGLGVMAKDALGKKADNATVMKILEQNKEQRIEDREEDKEQRQIQRAKDASQDAERQRVLNSIQILLIQMIKEK